MDENPEDPLKEIFERVCFLLGNRPSPARKWTSTSIGAVGVWPTVAPFQVLERSGRRRAITGLAWYRSTDSRASYL